jgi:hypothetical protein
MYIGEQLVEGTEEKETYEIHMWEDKEESGRRCGWSSTWAPPVEEHDGGILALNFRVILVTGENGIKRANHRVLM